MSAGVRHLYIHLPFCAHRCGYCDFVTVVGRHRQHADYVDALLRELELERGLLAERPETVYLGGGTPTFTQPQALARLLAALPRADELTVEANPETVTPTLAALLMEHGVTRVSLGAQSFREHLLAVLERQASPAAVRRAVHTLRGASFDNISLDLLYGVPGQSAPDLDRDLAEVLALEPEHVSCYELEAKPGTRFTHRFGGELRRQADAMETYFERAVDRLTGAGYRWYETASFCLSGREALHNLGYWLGHDYLGLGVGAVSTVAGLRWRNAPSIARYAAALQGGLRPPREYEHLADDVRLRERVILGLRLERPLPIAEVEEALDPGAADRLEHLGLLERTGSGLRLTPRGRQLGGGVTAELLA